MVKKIIKKFLDDKFGYQEDFLSEELANLLQKQLDIITNENYREGYREGYRDGGNQGYNEGYDDGYRDGSDNSY